MAHKRYAAYMLLKHYMSVESKIFCTFLLPFILNKKHESCFMLCYRKFRLYKDTRYFGIDYKVVYTHLTL